jgi:hypothetical protein
MRALAFLLSLLCVGISTSRAQFDAGGDLVSRYLWRGWDFGNSAAAQPYLSFGAPVGDGSLEAGAWGNFALTSGNVNELDLYASYSIGPVTAIFTDYYFPPFDGDDNFFDISDFHILELGAGVGNDHVSFTGYYAFSTPEDVEKSVYFEVAGTPPYSVDGIDLRLFIGAGNGFYDFVEEGKESEFVVTNIGITVSKGAISTTYAINPDQQTSFLVLMFSL